MSEEITLEIYIEMGTKWLIDILSEIFQQSLTSKKCPINLKQEQISVRLPPPLHIPFKLPTTNPNESCDSTDSKGMRPTHGGFTGGFALCTRSKVERSGHVTGLHLSCERRDRTDARAD